VPLVENPQYLGIEWDAENRLIAVNQGTLRSEFTYDGEGRRVRILEKDGSTVLADRHFVWCRRNPCEERNAGGTVVKRFFQHGFQQGGNSYYYVTDDIGSTYEVTDSSGTIYARYDYDAWGRRTKISGELDADFGFTGHFFHEPSGLHLAPHRAYDANLGRWISEDPMGLDEGPNLYAYVENDPIANVDPSGLYTIDRSCKNWGCQLMGGGGPNNPGQPPAPEDMEEVIRRGTDDWCSNLQRITNPKLRACIKKSCEKGKIKCKGKCDPDQGGFNLTWPIIGKGKRDANLCPNNWPDYTPLAYAGETVIHEWAHGCGWDEGEGGGVP
jgi:RHS repeat-associated protein